MKRESGYVAACGTGFFAAALLFGACSNAAHVTPSIFDPKDTPESRVGERLFREPRFSQLFFSESGGRVNEAVAGDPNLASLPRARDKLRSPFEGQTISCVACHMVDD